MIQLCHGSIGKLPYNINMPLEYCITFNCHKTGFLGVLILHFHPIH